MATLQVEHQGIDGMHHMVEHGAWNMDPNEDDVAWSKALVDASQPMGQRRFAQQHCHMIVDGFQDMQSTGCSNQLVAEMHDLHHPSGTPTLVKGHAHCLRGIACRASPR